MTQNNPVKIQQPTPAINFKILFSLLTFFLAFNSFAQSPGCDDTIGAEITVGACIPMDTNNSTNYWTGASGCGTQSNEDAWAWFTATSTSTTITYTPSNHTNPILHVFTGACDQNMTAITCSNTRGTGFQETITLTTTIGTQYRVRIENKRNNTMYGDICVTNNDPDTYCIPSSEPTPNQPRHIDDFITTGGLTDISNTNSGLSPAAYGDFTNLAVEQIQGSNIDFILNYDNGTDTNYYTTIWIDWNQDNTFTSSAPDERVFVANTIADSHSGTINASGLPGTYRMRIRSDWRRQNNPGVNDIEPCNDDYASEAEDYTFIVTECPVVTSTTDGIVCGNSGQANLEVTGTASGPGTGYHFYDAPTGGSLIFSTDDTGLWTTPIISSTTTYYVSAFSSTCESTVREPIVAEVIPTPTIYTPIAISGICGEDAIVEITTSAGASQQFNWTSTIQAYTDPAATIPYDPVTDTASSIYVNPTQADLQNNLFSFSVTITLNGGCTVAESFSIANNTKYFTGPTLGDTDWNDPNNWKPTGIPTNQNCVIIPDSYTCIINGTTHGNALNISVKSGATLNIQSNGSLTLVNNSNIDSDGTFEIESSGSLIQIQPVTNTGAGNVIRSSANVRDTDYIYWSAPVNNFNVSNISPQTPSYFIYQWVPTYAANTNQFGDWERISGTMNLGQGYIVRAGPNNSDATADTNMNANFRGVFNNGNITIGVSKGSWNSGGYTGPTTTPVSNNDDNWNLLGNPYPSAINAIDFLTANTNLEGAIHIWTHGTQISSATGDPFYEDFVLNYSINDYITYNASGDSSGPGTFSGEIASGQGFFTMLEHSATNLSVTFNNSMRTSSNNDFYKTSADQTKSDERHRIWLNLVAPNNQVATILVAYVEGATLAKDRMYDAYGMEDSNMSLYSKIEDERMIIQGRPTPFDVSDEVPLGAMIPSQGIYTIAINAVDGLFENESQNIFLEDLELGITHNLREEPYTFTAQNQIYHNRFVLRYTNHLLNIEDQNAIEALSITAPANKYIKVSSATKTIESITVFDLLGRVIIDKKDIDTTEYKLEDLTNTTGAFIVKVILAGGQEKTQKVVLKQ